MSTKVHKVFVSSYSEDNYYREKYLQLMNSTGFAVSRLVPDGILDGLPIKNDNTKNKDNILAILLSLSYWWVKIVEEKICQLGNPCNY